MKKIIFVIIIIIAGILIGTIIIGYFGNYPSFFPDFIKYNKFLPQIVTEKAFEIENFMDPEENFPAFLQEVEKNVHELWNKDAKLVYIEAFLVPDTEKDAFAYELGFESEKPYCQVLRVYYNARLILLKDPYFNESALLYHRVHFPKFTNDKNIVATDLTGQMGCLSYDIIPAEKIVIPGSKIFQLAAAKNPESTEIFKNLSLFAWLSSSNAYGKEPIRTYPFFWLIMDGSRIKIDATTGEILNENNVNLD